MRLALARIALAAALAVGLTLPADPLAHAEGADIGFARAEQIALAHVKGGTVKEMKRGKKQGRATFSVEVQGAENTEWDVLIDAIDGAVLKVKQDD